MIQGRATCLLLNLIEELELALLRQNPDSLSNWIGCSDPPISRRDAKRLAEKYAASFDGLAFEGEWDCIRDLIVEMAPTPVKFGEEFFGSFPIGVPDDEGGWWFGGHHPNGYIRRVGENYRWQVFEEKLTWRTAVPRLFRALLRRLKLSIPFVGFR